MTKKKERNKIGGHAVELSWSRKNYIGDYEFYVEYDSYPEWRVVWTLTPQTGGVYGLSKTTFDSGPGVRSSHGDHYPDFKAKSLKAAKAHVEKVAIAEERAQFEGTPNPYMGDAVSGAKQRKYGYPKPLKPKKNPNKGSQKMKRASSNPSKEQHQRYAQQSWAQARLMFREAVEEANKYEDERTSRRLMVALRAATATIKEATRTFWNAYDAGDWERAGKAAILVAEAEDIIAYITESESWAPVKMTGPETAYRVFDVRIPAGNPYRGDAVSAAKQRKYGYPKPPKGKTKKNPRGKMTKAEFAAMFREDMLPMIAERYEQDGVPDKPARREAWNNTVDAYILDGLLPESAGNWSHPSWLETAKKNPRHTAERAAKRDKHKRKKGKKGSMSPYARKRAGGGARKNPGTKKSLAAIMRGM